MIRKQIIDISTAMHFKNLVELSKLDNITLL